MAKRIVIIDYGMGNLHSVGKAFEAIGADVVVSRDPFVIEDAQSLVLPGVGSFIQGMKHLNELKIVDLLSEQVVVKEKPFLGICLGMQLAAGTGHEHGVTKGLGWIDAEVREFKVDTKIFKVPHMGWDDVKFLSDQKLFMGIKNPSTFYFVHSYHFVPKEDSIITSTCNYGEEFVSSISKKNIHLIQFHPEKSQKNGLRLLQNFLDY